MIFELLKNNSLVQAYIKKRLNLETNVSTLNYIELYKRLFYTQLEQKDDGNYYLDNSEFVTPKEVEDYKLTFLKK